MYFLVLVARGAAQLLREVGAAGGGAGEGGGAGAAQAARGDARGGGVGECAVRGACVVVTRDKYRRYALSTDIRNVSKPVVRGIFLLVCMPWVLSSPSTESVQYDWHSKEATHVQERLKSGGAKACFG